MINFNNPIYGRADRTESLRRFLHMIARNPKPTPGITDTGARRRGAQIITRPIGTKPSAPIFAGLCPFGTPG